MLRLRKFVMKYFSKFVKINQRNIFFKTVEHTEVRIFGFFQAIAVPNDRLVGSGGQRSGEGCWKATRVPDAVSRERLPFQTIVRE